MPKFGLSKIYLVLTFYTHFSMFFYWNFWSVIFWSFVLFTGFIRFCFNFIFHFLYFLLFFIFRKSEEKFQAEIEENLRKIWVKIKKILNKIWVKIEENLSEIWTEILETNISVNPYFFSTIWHVFCVKKIIFCVKNNQFFKQQKLFF